MLTPSSSDIVHSSIAKLEIDRNPAGLNFWLEDTIFLPNWKKFKHILAFYGGYELKKNMLMININLSRGLIPLES